jgi:peptidoglycan hydrolase-like protein with peptidoglycan-binding domain
MSEELQIGDSGAAVEQLQQQLQSLGYQVGDAGQFDEATEAAVRQFQQQNGLAETGTADADTQSSLESHSAGHAGAGDSSEQSAAASYQVGQLSPDGLHSWDGQAWQPVDNAQAATEDSSVGQLSPDGLHRWDGQAWQPVDQAGQQQSQAASLSPEQWEQLVSASIQIDADSGEA